MHFQQPSGPILHHVGKFGNFQPLPPSEALMPDTTADIRFVFLVAVSLVCLRTVPASRNIIMASLFAISQNLAGPCSNLAMVIPTS